jgi:PAS domain S-box-containing protein
VEAQSLLNEQVKLLFAALPMGMLAGLVNAAILVFVIWGVIDGSVLIAWYAILSLVTLVRFGLVYAYRRARPSPGQAAYWARLFTLGTAFSGVVWGSAGVFLFPAQLEHQIFIIFVLTGMTAGAVVSFSALWQVGLLFIVLTLTPLSARLLMQDQTMHMAMGLMALLFMVLMVLTTRSMYQTTLTSLKLRFENSDLVGVLGQGKAATEALNLELQREIDERSRVEEGLRDSEARMRTLIESVPDGIVTISDQGLLESMNPAAESIFGRKAEELIGRHFNSLMPESQRDDYDDYVRAHLGLGNGKAIGFGLEITGQRKDGSEFPMELGISHMWLERRHLFIGIVRDISERRAIERMKNQFLATVNHELRTPLTSVLGSLGLLSEGIAGELSERGRSLLDITRNNVQRLVRLIGNILDMDDIQSGRMRMDFRPVVLGRLVEQAVEDQRALAAAAGVHVELRNDAPRGLVYADGERILQTLNHLLSNALKFSPRGGTLAVDLESANGWLCVTVADQGPGVPAEFHEQIFQPFSHAATGDADVRSGAGLGLSIARAIVEQHAGTIGYKPGPQSGARFYFELPELHNIALESPTHAPE